MACLSITVLYIEGFSSKPPLEGVGPSKMALVIEVSSNVFLLGSDNLSTSCGRKGFSINGLIVFIWEFKSPTFGPEIGYLIQILLMN